MTGFYNPNWLLLLRLSVFEIGRSAFTCFSARVCDDLAASDVVVLKVLSLNLSYMRPPSRSRWPVTDGALPFSDFLREGLPSLFSEALTGHRVARIAGRFPL